jgi:hypothetical protein
VLRAAELLADSNVIWAALRSGGKFSATADSKLMELLYRACKDAIKAASMLIKALIAPRGRQQDRPSDTVLQAAAAVSHELIEGLYDVLLKSQSEQSDPNVGSSGAAEFSIKISCHTTSSKCRLTSEQLIPCWHVKRVLCMFVLSVKWRTSMFASSCSAITSHGTKFLQGSASLSKYCLY